MKLKYSSINPASKECIFFSTLTSYQIDLLASSGLEELNNENCTFLNYELVFKRNLTPSFAVSGLITLHNRQCSVLVQNKNFLALASIFGFNGSQRRGGEFHFQWKHLNLMKCFSPGVLTVSPTRAMMNWCHQNNIKLQYLQLQLHYNMAGRTFSLIRQCSYK